MKRVTPDPVQRTCILTPENMATEDDCTTHQHEPCETCGGTGRWETSFEDSPTTLTDCGPCPGCVGCDTRTGLVGVAQVVRALDALHGEWADQDFTDSDTLTGEEFDRRELDLLRDLYELM